MSTAPLGGRSSTVREEYGRSSVMGSPRACDQSDPSKCAHTRCTPRQNLPPISEVVATTRQVTRSTDTPADQRASAKINAKLNGPYPRGQPDRVYYYCRPACPAHLVSTVQPVPTNLRAEHQTAPQAKHSVRPPGAAIYGIFTGGVRGTDGGSKFVRGPLKASLDLSRKR